MEVKAQTFGEVKRLVAKSVGKQKRLFSEFFGSTGRILETQELFPKAYFTPEPNMCIFAPCHHGLLEYARILGFGPILGR